MLECLSYVPFKIETIACGGLMVFRDYSFHLTINTLLQYRQ